MNARQATVADAARAAAGSPTSQATAGLLRRLLGEASASAAAAFLASHSCTKAQRVQLARLTGLESAWVDCDQKIEANVADLAAMLVAELYEPFWFFRGSLSAGEAEPRALFGRQMASRPLQQRGKEKYWMASSGVRKAAWLPPLCTAGEDGSGATFEAVVHFVQAGSGTGVHVGGGRVLTCAHVVDGRDDDAEDEEDKPPPQRAGRQKVVMFSSGRTFIAQCAAVDESQDSVVDVALMMLGAEVDVRTLPPSQGGDTSAAPASLPSLPLELPAAAIVAEHPVREGDLLFCVGNPSSVDLESVTQGTIEFEPPTFHTSVGQCVGYLDPEVGAQRKTQRARGQASTRGELKAVADAPVASAEEGTYLQHSCWTYWGHSGAPLFNEAGAVAGLHCAWDESTGMRQGQKVQNLHSVLRLGAATAAVEKKRGGVKAAGGEATEVAATSKRRRC